MADAGSPPGKKEEPGKKYCYFCGKPFARDEHLERHIMIHTGSKPFHCGICHMAFGRRDLLNRHNLVHNRDVNGAEVPGGAVHPGTAKAAGRVPIACKQCAQSKTKCDRQAPCSRCKLKKLDCQMRDTRRAQKADKRLSVSEDSEDASGSNDAGNEPESDYSSPEGPTFSPGADGKSRQNSSGQRNRSNTASPASNASVPTPGSNVSWEPLKTSGSPAIVPDSHPFTDPNLDYTDFNDFQPQYSQTGNPLSNEHLFGMTSNASATLDPSYFTNSFFPADSADLAFGNVQGNNSFDGLLPPFSGSPTSNTFQPSVGHDVPIRNDHAPNGVVGMLGPSFHEASMYTEPEAFGWMSNMAQSHRDENQRSISPTAYVPAEYAFHQPHQTHLPQQPLQPLGMTASRLPSFNAPAMHNSTRSTGGYPVATSPRQSISPPHQALSPRQMQGIGSHQSFGPGETKEYGPIRYSTWD